MSPKIMQFIMEVFFVFECFSNLLGFIHNNRYNNILIGEKNLFYKNAADPS